MQANTLIKECMKLKRNKTSCKNPQRLLQNVTRQPEIDSPGGLRKSDLPKNEQRIQK